MPFRIENILKKDTSSKAEREEKKMENARSESILQQTLQNRLQRPYYRPVNENFGIGGDGFQTYNNCCRSVCYPSHYYHPYIVNDYPYSFEKKYYSIHHNLHTPIFTGPYGVYSKRKGGQVRFTPNQTDILEKRFLSNKYLSPEDRKRLADNLNLSDKQVKTWFQNRRAKWKRNSSASPDINDNEKSNQHSEIVTISNK